MQRFKRLFGTARLDRSETRTLRDPSSSLVGLLVGLIFCLNFALEKTVAQPRQPSTPAALQTDMDGSAPVLLPLKGTARFRILQHQIDRRYFRFGSGAERVALSCPAGNSAPLAYPIPRAPGIGEFRVDL